MDLYTILLIANTLLALLLIGFVLIQKGKGADAGAAFGAGASGTVFGARGSASFFSRATAVLATLFFLNSIVLAWMSMQEAEAPTSLLDSVPEEVVEAPEPTEIEALPSLEAEPVPTENDTIEALPAVEEEPQSEEPPSGD